MKVCSLNSKPGTDWLENSSDDESEEPVLSLNNGVITVRINEQRIKMIVNGSKYDTISSELHKMQFKNYELKLKNVLLRMDKKIQYNRVTWTLPLG